MNWFQFVASIVSSIAWPLVALGIVAILRDPLSLLLRSLHHLGIQGVELDFGQQLANIEHEVDREKSPDRSFEPKLAEGSSAPRKNTPEAGTEAKWDIDDEVRALAAQSPDSAVVRAWIEIERILAEAMMRLGYGTDSRRSPLNGIRTLHSNGYIDDETNRILVRLSLLRNQVVHPQSNVPVTYAEALEYAHLAKRMAQRLRTIELR